MARPARNTCPWAEDGDANDVHTKDLEMAARKRAERATRLRQDALLVDESEVIDFHTKDLQTAAVKRAQIQEIDAGTETEDIHTKDLEVAARKRAVLQQHLDLRVGRGQGSAPSTPRLPQREDASTASYASPRIGQDKAQVELIMQCIEEGRSGEEIRRVLEKYGSSMFIATKAEKPSTLAAKRAEMMTTPRTRPADIDVASSRQAYLEAQKQVIETKAKNRKGATNLLSIEEQRNGGQQLETEASSIAAKRSLKTLTPKDAGYDQSLSRESYVHAQTAATATKARNAVRQTKLF